MSRPMVASDAARLAEIHATSWGQHELSVKLGPEFLRLFYDTVAADHRAFGRVHERDEVIIGYAIGFTDYRDFNRRFQARHRRTLQRLLARRVATGRVWPPDILNLLMEGRKMRKARFPDSHLGALALANEVKRTPVGGAAIVDAMTGVMEGLRAAGSVGCSCVCDFRNIPLRTHLSRLGFQEVDVVRLLGKRIVLCEKDFLASDDD
jgi:hypothetical protein